MDTSEVGHIAARLMDEVEAEFTGGEELGEVAIVAEVNRDGDDPETWVEVICTDPRRWVQAGLLKAAERVIQED